MTALAKDGDAAAFNDVDSSHQPVGTELYRPADGVRGNASAALDFFAAGVVAFELVWPFSTRKLPILNISLAEILWKPN